MIHRARVAGAARGLWRWYGSPLRALWRSGPPAILLIAFLGAGVGAVTIFVDWPFGDEAGAFTESGAFSLWVFLFVAQTALWALALIPLAASLRALWRFGQRGWGRVIGVTVFTAVPLGAFIGATWLTERDYPLPHHEWKLRAIVILGAAVALVGVLGMALVHEGLGKLADRPLDDEPTRRAAIGDYLLFREHLQRLLALEGAIIGAAVLATAALRKAILAYADKIPDTAAPTFPAEDVLIYGATFSILLALLWAPIYARLVAVGARLRLDAVGAEPAEGESWPDWQERRRKHDSVLGLEGSALASFRAGVAILTPLASGLLGILFKF